MYRFIITELWWVVAGIWVVLSERLNPSNCLGGSCKRGLQLLGRILIQKHIWNSTIKSLVRVLKHLVANSEECNIFPHTQNCWWVDNHMWDLREPSECEIVRYTYVWRHQIYIPQYVQIVEHNNAIQNQFHKIGIENHVVGLQSCESLYCLFENFAFWWLGIVWVTQNLITELSQSLVCDAKFREDDYDPRQKSY